MAHGKSWWKINDLVLAPLMYTLIWCSRIRNPVDFKGPFPAIKIQLASGHKVGVSTHAHESINSWRSLVNGANPISNRWSFVIIIPIEIALFLEHKPFYGSLTWLRCGHIALRDGPSPRVKRPGPGATGVSEWYKTLIDDVPSSTVFLHMWRVPWRWSPVHDSHSPRFRGPAAMGFHWLSWVITFLWTPGNLVKEPSIWRYGPERISAKSALFLYTVSAPRDQASPTSPFSTHTGQSIGVSHSATVTHSTRVGWWFNPSQTTQVYWEWSFRIMAEMISSGGSTYLYSVQEIKVKVLWQGSPFCWIFLMIQLLIKWPVCVSILN